MAIMVYGTPTCVDCIRSKRLLDKHAVEYEFIDIGQDPAAAQKVLDTNNGLSITPTIFFEDGSTLSEPSDAELAQKLGLNLD